MKSKALILFITLSFFVDTSFSLDLKTIDEIERLEAEIEYKCFRSFQSMAEFIQLEEILDEFLKLLANLSEDDKKEATWRIECFVSSLAKTLMVNKGFNNKGFNQQRYNSRRVELLSRFLQELAFNEYFKEDDIKQEEKKLFSWFSFS